MIRLEEKPDIRPLCPHCGQALDELWFREIAGMLGKRYLYFCPSCSKVLGISHRKGFWMG